MHLVIVTNELATADCSSGGLASFTANLARIFKRNGHKVSVILVTTKKDSMTFDKDIPLYNVYVEKNIWDELDSIGRSVSAIMGEDPDETRRFIMNIYKSKLVKKLVGEIHNREKVDIVHVCNLQSLAIAFDDKIPYVIRISSYFNMWEGAEMPEAQIEYGQKPLTLLNKQDAYTVQRSRFVISPSNLLAEVGRKNLDINPTVIESPFVLDKDNWDNSIYDSLIKGRKYIIHYGRLSYTKGTHIVAKIAKDILKRYPEMRLVLAGYSGDMLDENGKTVKAHELVMYSAEEYADRIIYAGRLVREQLYPLVQHAEICLLPSRIENLSNACIEAMAMGKVVVATNGASFEQLIDDRVSGFLCERDYPDSFMKAVEEALDMDEDAKGNMIAKATERIKQLAPDVIYKRYYRYYQEVIREWNDK